MTYIKPLEEPPGYIILTFVKSILWDIKLIDYKGNPIPKETPTRFEMNNDWFEIRRNHEI